MIKDIINNAILWIYRKNEPRLYLNKLVEINSFEELKLVDAKLLMENLDHLTSYIVFDKNKTQIDKIKFLESIKNYINNDVLLNNNCLKNYSKENKYYDLSFTGKDVNLLIHGLYLGQFDLIEYLIGKIDNKKLRNNNLAAISDFYDNLAIKYMNKQKNSNINDFTSSIDENTLNKTLIALIKNDLNGFDIIKRGLNLVESLDENIKYCTLLVKSEQEKELLTNSVKSVSSSKKIGL